MSGNALRAGVTVSGYCAGFFGRDSYGDKMCVATGEDRGERWAIFRELDGFRDWTVLHGDDVDTVLEEADDVSLA